VEVAKALGGSFKLVTLAPKSKTVINWIEVKAVRWPQNWKFVRVTTIC